MRTSTLLPAVALSAAAANTCCQQIQRLLPQKTSFPNSAAYNATEAAFLSLQESDLKPACVIHPTTAQDVSLAMGVISKTPPCLFAVKGRGHTPAAGSANIQDGVTIDMTSLSDIDVSPDRSVAHVGAGSAWLSVYKVLQPMNLAVAGGRNGLVGAGGLLLGGGISHFTTREGWACDAIVNYEVVLANGQIVHANASSHAPLYHALRGGGNNLGVVTRFDLATFPQGNISVTSIVNDISHMASVFDAFTDIVTSTPFDEDTSLVTNLLFNSASKAWTLTSSAVYTKPVSRPHVYEKLSAVPSLSTGNVITSLAEFANEKAPPHINWVFSTATFRPSSSFMVQLFDMLNATLFDFDPEGGVVWDVALEPLAGKMLSTGATLGMGDTGRGYVMLLSALWPNSASRYVVSETAKVALSGVEQAARARNLLQRFQYLNYAAAYQTPLQSYGRERYQLLKKVSREYDPREVLQRQLRGGYKLL